jgi:hypothetical protein
MTIRQVRESPITQGADESVAYALTTTPWGSSPGTVSAKIYSIDNATGEFTDVTTTNMTGSASAAGDVITLPVISGLTAGTRYRVEVKFTCAGNVLETYAIIEAER